MQTLQSEAQKFVRLLPKHGATHPFASGSGSSQKFLQDMIAATEQISHSLNVYLSMDVNNPKLVSLLREHSSRSQNLHLAEHHVQQTIQTLREHSGPMYGEDIPVDRRHLLDWTLGRIESWGAAAGMEIFRDVASGGGITFVLGGKVLVVDIVFAVQTNQDVPADTAPRFNVASVKTSYAIPSHAPGDGASTTTDASVSLDALLAEDLQRFLDQVQLEDEVRDPIEAAKLGIVLSRQLKHLVKLDQLAVSQKENGLEWFVNVDTLAPKLEHFSTQEAEVVASSLSAKHAPLDVFLLRSHSLPLPYLTGPSMSFLVHVSPMVYLTLKRMSLSEPVKNPNLPALDVEFSHIRSHLKTYPVGATLADLRLLGGPDANSNDHTTSLPTFAIRPSFQLASFNSDLDHIFPQSSLVEDGQTNAWVLDFTGGGSRSGVIMSQSRMQDIELVVKSLSDMEHNLDAIRMIPFVHGNWVDLLLNPSAPVSPERYTALWRSPSSMHPPLQLRLTPPDEPGFKLEQVKVRTVKEVLAVLEVVKEQCWLNEILVGCNWSPEGLMNADDMLPTEDESTNLQELDAVLNGRFTPRKIPVSVYLPPNEPDTLFGSSDLDIPMRAPKRPKITMTSPERAPMSGLVETCVTFDETKPRGVSVQVNGAMGADLKTDVLEEVSRRGGTLGLAGRIWTAHQSSK